MRLWEQPTEIFQQYQGLLTFAVLSRTKNAEETLRQVSRLIDNKGKAEEKNQIALKMLRSNVAIDLVAEFTGLTLKQIEKLQKLSTKQSKSTKSPKAKKSPNT